MRESGSPEVAWVRAGVAGGLWACIAYPLAVFAPLPPAARAAVAASFGPALGFGCAGLWRLIRLHGGSVAAAAAAGANALAGALFTAMVLVQMAAGDAAAGPAARSLQPVWLGLDVAWDTYIGTGTLLFGFSMIRHPRFGRVFGGIGILLGFSLLFLNLYTFPTPPANAGLVDLGPAIGLWYLAVTVQMWRSLKWAREAEGAGSG